MDVATRLRLGQSTNLLAGYKADLYSLPFITSSQPALNDSQVLVRSPDYDAEWSWPTISLHGNAEDLLSATLPIKLRPPEDVLKESCVPGVWPAGALVLSSGTGPSHVKARKTLSHQLGVKLNQDWSYALVRRSRKIGTATHPCYERGVFGHPEPDTILRPDTLAALKSLEKMQRGSTNVSKTGAEGYLEFYETYGSHFVSGADIGDTIFQVFCFASVEFQTIARVYEKRPDDLSGPRSTSFVLFTTPRSASGYGHTAAIGKICITSQDPEMAKTLKDGLWRDDKYAGANSIFAPFLRSDAVDANVTFKKAVVISRELASLGVFAEYYRTLIWRGVFKAAMYAKYHSGSGVAPYFTNNCPYDLDSVFQDSDPLGGDGLLSTLATPSVSIWQEKLNLGDVVLQFPELVKIFSVFANAIQIPANSNEKTTIDVPGSSTVSLFGHVVTSGGTGPSPPHLRLREPAFRGIKRRICCGEFYGGLHISSSSDTKDLVIMDGLMFQNVKGQVSVVRDVRETLNPAVVTGHLTDIQFALVAAEARLNFLLPNAASQGQSLGLLKRFLLWLAEVAGSGNRYQNDQLAPLQARAMYLASVVAADHGAGVPVPYLRYEAYKDVVENVQHTLRTASGQLTHYQNQIRARRAEERQVRRASSLNRNIVNSAKLLSDFIGAQASYQQRLEEIFSSVHQEKMDELEQANKRADQLGLGLSEQRVDVDDAIGKYQQAVGEWIEEETIRAALDIASGLFSLGFTVKASASSIGALINLSVTVERIQKAVEVFDAVIKTYRAIKDVPSNPKQVVDSLRDIGPSGLDLPSSHEWDEMKVNFEATLASGPAIEATRVLAAAFAVLVLRGKALLQTQRTVQEIVADLSAYQQRVSLHERQKKRLDELEVTLNAGPENLEVERVDLIGLSGEMNFFQRQMLMTLASTVVIQDRALQYEYLRPPTPIGSFSMLNLQLAILNQSQSITYGLTVQPRPKSQRHPVIYEIHGVTPGSITNNQRRTFNIDLNKREFSSYNYVRIEDVQVEIGGITSTNCGKYYTELVFDGDPFFDRDFDGRPLEFKTDSRIFTGLHDVSTSCHVSCDGRRAHNPTAVLATTGQDPFGAKTSSITPFSSWQVSLPNTQGNRGIEFDKYLRGVTVRLIFHIYAQLKESTMTPSEMNSAARRLLIREDYAKTVSESKLTSEELFTQSLRPMTLTSRLPSAKKPHGPTLAGTSEELFTQSIRSMTLTSRLPSAKNARGGGLATKEVAPMALAAKASAASDGRESDSSSTTTSVSRDDVLRAMKGTSVCAGWDVVFSMTAEQVNDQLYGQYTNRSDNPVFIRKTGNVEHEVKTSEGRTLKTVFNFTFNAPRLQFLLNNSNSAQVFMPIISGTYEYSVSFNDTWIKLDTAEVKKSDGAYIQGDVPLSIVPGSVSTQHNVAIKLKGGAFSARNFKAANANPTFGVALTSYFTSLKDGYEVYKLGTLDLKGITILESLHPKSFLFNVYHTPSNRDLLQLFVATTGRLQSATSLYIQEPIPSIYDCSLIVNSKIFFQDVVPTSLGDGGIGLKLEARGPSDDANTNAAWSADATRGSVTAPFPVTKVGSDVLDNSGDTDFTSYNEVEYYVKVDNDTAVVDLSGMRFLPGDETSGWDAKMVYSPGIRKYPFKYGSRFKCCNLLGCSGWSPIYYSDHYLDVTIDMGTTLPLTVTGDGQKQSIGFATTESSVSLRGNLKPPGGVCKCLDRDLQKDFLDNLKRILPKELVGVFNKPFDTVSVFALENLVFPAKNFVTMEKGAVPGDLIVFGKFTAV